MVEKDNNQNLLNVIRITVYQPLPTPQERIFLTVESEGITIDSKDQSYYARSPDMEKNVHGSRKFRDEIYSRYYFHLSDNGKLLIQGDNTNLVDRIKKIN